jgi:hypothetical protein
VIINVAEWLTTDGCTCLYYLTWHFIITWWFVQFYWMYYMYYYFPQMLEYQDIQGIHFLTRGVLLYTNFKSCTPAPVLCLITCKLWAKIRNEALSHLNGYSLTAGFPGTYADFPWCRWADSKISKRMRRSLSILWWPHCIVSRQQQPPKCQKYCPDCFQHLVFRIQSNKSGLKVKSVINHWHYFCLVLVI